MTEEILGSTSLPSDEVVDLALLLPKGSYLGSAFAPHQTLTNVCVHRLKLRLFHARPQSERA